MFKLVAIGGKIRGQEIELTDGDNEFGRSNEAQHVIDFEGISKKHMRISVNNNNCFLEDMGSSNGTFVNGKLVKKATIKDKDKIALPNIIFQVVHVKEKKKIIKKKIQRVSDDASEFGANEVMPKDFFGKIKYKFKNDLMKVFYSFNEEYEWNVMLGVILVGFLSLNIYISIGPVLDNTQGLIQEEIKARGRQYAAEVARINAIHMKRGDLQRIDTIFMDRLSSEGVESYELFDMDGRMVRPASKIDTIVRDTFSIKAWNKFKNSGQYGLTYYNDLGDGQIGIAKTLVVPVAETGQNEAVGVIAIKFRPESLRRFNRVNSTSYLKAFVYCTIAAVFFYGFIYYLTLRPLNEMKFQAEEVMRGNKKELSSGQLFVEINGLRSNYNTVLQKNRELQNEDVGDFVDIEDDVSYVSIFNEVLQGAAGAAMILNSEKRVEYINDLAEDLTGMRENLVKGEDILDCAPNDGIAGTLIKLCDASASNNGTSQKDYYDLEGDPYEINVASLIGKDNFPKAYYITLCGKDKGLDGKCC